jgi:hypothetical protein
MFQIVTRAAVVFWQIKTDNLDHIWPIKMLRIIVIITITTLFPTFLELCLDPLDVSTYTALIFFYAFSAFSCIILPYYFAVRLLV